MAAHLPFVMRPNDAGVRLVNFHDAFQYCIRQSWEDQKKAAVLKVITALGSTLILFLLGFWSADPQHHQRNEILMIAGKSLALLVSVSSILNYLYDFQRRSNKYESARRVISLLEANYTHAVRNKLTDVSYLDQMELWAKKNFTKIEERLDNDKVYDVGMDFKEEPLPQ